MEYGDTIILSPDDLHDCITGYGVDTIGHHLSLIEQAGFIEQTRGRPAIGILFSGLTWAGHDFIDSVRDQDVWEKTKSIAARAGGFTVEILVASAKGILEQMATSLLRGQH